VQSRWFQSERISWAMSLSHKHSDWDFRREMKHLRQLHSDEIRLKWFLEGGWQSEEFSVHTPGYHFSDDSWDLSVCHCFLWQFCQDLRPVPVSLNFCGNAISIWELSQFHPI
jgi:hypothetical protein